MSSNLTTLTPGGKPLPAAFQGAKLASAFVGQQFEKASDGLEGTYNTISYAGKVWSITYKGEKKAFLRTDDGTPRGSIDVVFVRTASNKAKTYYEGFKEGAKEKPLCFSNDGVRPDPSIPAPPSKACAICPKNVFGSRITDDGRQAKACGDHKRTAAVLDPTIAMEVLGAPLSEAVLLRIPAASLTDFATFGDSMEQQGHPLPSFITRLTFDHTKNYPKLKFEAIKPLNEEEGKIAMALRDDVITKRIVAAGVDVTEGEEVTGSDNIGQQAPIQPLSQGLPQTHPTNAASHVVGAPAQPGPGTQGQTNGPADANVVALPIAPRREATLQQVNPNPAQEQRPTPVQQAQAMVGDAGAEPVTDFDKELNDEIGALLS